MLYLQEKDSRMQFERNMNRKLENQEFAQSNLKAIISAQKSEIERLKIKDGENEGWWRVRSQSPFTIVNRVHNFVNGVHKIIKINTSFMLLFEF